MNATNKIIITILTLVLFLNLSLANESKYKLNIANLNYTSDKSLEFDIYLISTISDKEDLKYSIGQYFLEFNPNIANGGKLSYSIISSDLPEAMRPRNASVSENLLRLACNSVNSDKENLPVITTKSPGILIVRMKLETSADKFSSEPLNLKWTDGTNRYRTKIFVFDGKQNEEITNSENHASDFSSKDGISQNNAELPTEYSLLQNYPNPFNPETKIKFDIPNLSNVKLSIYDITGREVATLVNKQLEPGRYDYKFTGSNFASGIYFYKIHAGTFTMVRRMVLIK
ncbi:MAG: T9SS type A sorting domain-containing protein [bacterium]